MIDLSTLIKPDDPKPIYVQLVEGLRHAITQGRLAVGTRLPASRTLAHDLGVSRSTVIQSYDQLVAEGYIASRPGSGVFVEDITPLAAVPAPIAPLATSQAPHSYTSGMLRPGEPDPALFPTGVWARTIARVSRSTPEALCILNDPFGDDMLRAEIANYLHRWRGMTCTPDQILVTSGAREALELGLDLVIDGQDIGLESPGFSPLHRFAAVRHWPVRWLTPGQHGPELPRDLAKVTVLTPSHQFPLGGTLPIAQRQAFLAQAQAQDAWIIEDDFDSEFRYAGQPVPAMAGLDQTGRCLYVGTFSKTFSHAIRLGYLVLPPALVPHMRQRFVHPSAGASVTAQRPLAHFMADGQYDKHIRRARRHYGERYEAAVTALANWPKVWGRFRHHRAGMQIAFHLAEGIDDTQICATAASEGFAVQPLSSNTPVGAAQGLLIGFCRTQPQDIAPQIAQLGQHISATQTRAF
ncbi:aminotransferase class I/II-fold pyridoxal phosphate-dependent enzyme [Epibacterium sp. SM1979]|uniref:Aminotransferase class I/II-fold pyridoxal phosphate-dependent enzyme n=1 Tax=Tritonibacter litoralis TaxID=2662264 RepID=A0A843YKC9_9RHOB|nr:PLP-dependent aminotransferase family protein [Tritonibacter litoralis]MQQ09722.1 aminotransferase class I/II-fold pyridoxal phosphate-dependent enzyme [Tritonibacter litoralis]